MGRSSVKGPACGGIFIVPMENHKVAGSPTNSFDYHCPFFMRFLAMSSFWNGVGATTQYSFENFTTSPTTLFASHVPAATEMVTTDGAAYGAAAGIAFPTNVSRDTARQTEGGGTDFFSGELTLALNVDGTFAALAYSIHIFFAVNSQRMRPTQPEEALSAGRNDWPYYHSSENQA